jgi:hypothetical protein
VDIWLDRNGNWELLFSDTPNDGSEVWTVTEPCTSQAEILVIANVNNEWIWDSSDNDFTISGCSSITVDSPNGGEDWVIGTGQTIQWSSSGATGNVDIWLNRNGSWELLFSDMPNDGSEAWTVTGPSSSQAEILVIAMVNNAWIWDYSDNYFTIIE